METPFLAAAIACLLLVAGAPSRADASERAAVEEKPQPGEETVSHALLQKGEKHDEDTSQSHQQPSVSAEQTVANVKTSEENHNRQEPPDPTAIDAAGDDQGTAGDAENGGLHQSAEQATGQKPSENGTLGSGGETEANVYDESDSESAEDEHDFFGFGDSYEDDDDDDDDWDDDDEDSDDDDDYDFFDFFAPMRKAALRI